VHISEQQADICKNFLPLNFALQPDKLKRGAVTVQGIRAILGTRSIYRLSKRPAPALRINRGFDSHRLSVWMGAELQRHDGELEFTKDFWHNNKPGSDVTTDVHCSTTPHPPHPCDTHPRAF
jgi:hypothetical protein